MTTVKLRTLDPAPRGPALTGAEVLDRIGPRAEAKRHKDLLVYVHVPFCTSKCHFCDWVSGIEVRDLVAAGDVRARYVDALCEQIRWYGPRLMGLGYRPRHVYWGGGTPTRLEADEIARVSQAIDESFDLSGLVQWSVEASPETLTPDKLAALRRGGAHRLSLGVQSFDEAQLRRAGRAHDAEQAAGAMAMVRAAGFDSYNIDLIAGFPEETPGAFARGLERAMELGPPHVTLYMYRSPRTTVMAQQASRGSRPTTSVESLREARRQGVTALGREGYDEYMTMYFAKSPEHRYLGEAFYYAMEGDYVGFGDGAHSLLGHHYLRNTPQALGKGGANLARFIESPTAIDTCELHSTPERTERLRATLIEAMLTECGVPYDRFEDRFGFDFRAIRQAPAVRRLVEYYRSCGAAFEEDEAGLRVTAATRADAFVLHTARANELGQLMLQYRPDAR